MSQESVIWVPFKDQNLFKTDVTLVISTIDAQLPLCFGGQAHRGCGEKWKKDLSHEVSHFSLR